MCPSCITSIYHMDINILFSSSPYIRPPPFPLPPPLVVYHIYLIYAHLIIIIIIIRHLFHYYSVSFASGAHSVLSYTPPPLTLRQPPVQQTRGYSSYKQSLTHHKDSSMRSYLSSYPLGIFIILKCCCVCPGRLLLY